MFAYLVRVDKVGAFTRNRTEVWRRMRLFACVALTITVIICGSFWWERAFATLKYSTIRKDGCFRMDDYRPFWILPDFLHFYADDGVQTLVGWDEPVFSRVVDQDTGEVLGETPIYIDEPSHRVMWFRSSLRIDMSEFSLARHCEALGGFQLRSKRLVDAEP
jgi:hypothetical protein